MSNRVNPTSSLTSLNGTSSAQPIVAKMITNFSIDSIIGSNTSTTSNHERPRKRTIDCNQMIIKPTEGEQIRLTIVKNSQEPETDNEVNVEDDQDNCGSINEQKLIIQIDDKYNQQKPHQRFVAGTKRIRQKNFHCYYCKTSFSNNGQLRNHVRIHTGERPFKCNQANCQKSFTRNEELTRHKRIHTGLKPYACSRCGQKFGRKDHLQKHQKIHDKVRSRRRTNKQHHDMIKFKEQSTKEIIKESEAINPDQLISSLSKDGFRSTDNQMTVPNPQMVIDSKLHFNTFGNYQDSRPIAPASVLAAPIVSQAAQMINAHLSRSPATSSTIPNLLPQSSSYLPSIAPFFPTSLLLGGKQVPSPLTNSQLFSTPQEYMSKWVNDLLALSHQTQHQAIHR